MFRSRPSTPFVFLLVAGTSCCVVLSARADDIHQFVEKGQLERVKALLDANPKQVNAPDKNDETPLHIAIHRGHLEVAKLLLERGADVEAIAYNRFRPLHLAQDGESVKLLVAHKANLEARESNGRTALENAAFLAAGRPDVPENPWWQIVKTLLKAGAYYDIRTAALLGDVERVGVLLKAKPGEAKDQTLMRFAAMHGHAAVVKLLLEHKADPTDADYGGLPLLDFAINYPAVVRLLIDAGADPKVRLNYRGNGAGPPEGSTLLHSAAMHGQVKTAEILLANGVPIDARTDRGHTPLHWV